MKKALALVLALVLALSMAVSAFAADFMTLIEVPTATAATEKITVVSLDALTPTAEGTSPIVYTYESGVAYVALNKDVAYKDVKVTASGNVSAELVAFDATKMVFDGLDADALNTYILYAKDYKQYLGADGAVDSIHLATGHSYEAAVALAKKINADNLEDTWTVMPRFNLNIIKLTIAENYSAAYTSGKVVVEAKVYDAATKTDKAYKGSFTVINDVTIFEYNMVNWAANHSGDKVPEFLSVVTNGSIKGYSDYQTAGKGYDLVDDDNYIADELRKINNPAVVSTTAFRAIAGKDLIVKSAGMKVVIDDVAAYQPGVNFKGYEATLINADGLTEDELLEKDEDAIFAAAGLKFGFYGNQVIKSDFTVSTTLDYTWFTLLDELGIKIEEDDIVSYYVLKDGKLVAEYKIDYMTIDEDKAAEIEIECKAGETLGQYELVLEVPASEAAGESNPNTGAESVVGVVAALAVVSLASAAAVSLKK